MRIQYSTAIQFTDGEIVKRSCCQFIDLNTMVKDLILSYLSTLDPV